MLIGWPSQIIAWPKCSFTSPARYLFGKQIRDAPQKWLIDAVLHHPSF